MRTLLLLALLQMGSPCPTGTIFFAGLFFGIVAGWSMKKAAGTDTRQPFFECPHCHEAVRTGSTVCTHCHSKLNR